MDQELEEEVLRRVIVNGEHRLRVPVSTAYSISLCLSRLRLLKIKPLSVLILSQTRFTHTHTDHIFMCDI